MKSKKNPEFVIGRNSSIYFAIGLNLMLFITWQALEFKSYESEDVSIEYLHIAEEYEAEIPLVTMDIPPPTTAIIPASIRESIQIVDDVEDVVETVIESSETGQDEAIVPHIVDVDAVEVEEVEEDVEVPFSVIEDIPIFPGCEGMSKVETKECFQQKMNEHIAKNFKYPEVALSMGLQGRVSVIFIIDSTGDIIGIRSRGPDKILEEEAERIIGLLPKMTPGKQRGKAVKVPYAVPIFFKYEER